MITDDDYMDELDKNLDMLRSIVGTDHLFGPNKIEMTREEEAAFLHYEPGAATR